MNNKDTREMMKNLSLVIQLGLTVIVPVMLLTFLGVFIDKKFDTYFTIPLLILGILGGVSGAFSLIKKTTKLKDEPKEEYDLMAGWYEDVNKDEK